MKNKWWIIVLLCIFVFSMVSVGVASGPNNKGLKTMEGQSESGFCPSPGEGEGIGQQIREQARDQERVQDHEECVPDEENGEENPKGMPFRHGISGEEFGNMISQMAQEGPGNVARYMHQLRFCYPTLE